MDKFFQDAIEHIQKQIYTSHGIRTEATYREGKGVLFVTEGFALAPHNVIYAVSEIELRILANLGF